MKQIIFHDWNLSEAEAIEFQFKFSAHVELEDRLEKVNKIAGVDVAYDEKNDRLVATAVVLDVTSLSIIEKAISEDIVQFPYIPGLFSFRELPSISKALQQLQCQPDIIICDAHGIAHPRRFGLACHVGILFETPTIGCAKTLLQGVCEEPKETRGEFSPIVDRGEIIGRALRTQDKVKPVYVSAGHRISLPTACDWILKLCTKYRLPETTRAADQLVKKYLTLHSRG